MESASRENIKFKGTPAFFAELVKHSLEQLKDVIGDPTLSLDIEPDIEQKPHANIVTVTFQTKSKTNHESQSGAGGWINYPAKKTQRTALYYDYGRVTAKTSPDNETRLDAIGYQTEPGSTWLDLWQWLHTKLLEESYIVVQSDLTGKIDDNEGNVDDKSHMKRSSVNKTIAVALLALGVVTTLVANVATSTLPKEFGPYLWLSWPLLLVLTAGSILLLRQQ